MTAPNDDAPTSEAPNSRFRMKAACKNEACYEGDIDIFPAQLGDVQILLDAEAYAIVIYACPTCGGHSASRLAPAFIDVTFSLCWHGAPWPEAHVGSLKDVDLTMFEVLNDLARL